MLCNIVQRDVGYYNIQLKKKKKIDISLNCPRPVDVLMVGSPSGEPAGTIPPGTPARRVIVVDGRSLETWEFGPQVAPRRLLGATRPCSGTLGSPRRPSGVLGDPRECSATLGCVGGSQGRAVRGGDEGVFRLSSGELAGHRIAGNGCLTT